MTNDRTEYCRQWYLEHREEKITYAKKYYQNNRLKILENQRKYTEENKEKILERRQLHDRQRRRYEDRKQKERIQKIAYFNVLLGDKCEVCDSTENLVRHHFDYDKPLNVTTLCRRCHRTIHGGA